MPLLVGIGCGKRTIGAYAGNHSRIGGGKFEAARYLRICKGSNDDTA